MDVFGQALLSYYRGQSDAPIRLVRDDGWEDEHSPGLYFQPDPFDFERPALGLINGPTLDIGCGAGRHLKLFGAHGQRAHGVDISQGAVAVCREQGFLSVAVFDVLSDIRPNLPFAPENISLFGNNVGIGGTFQGSTQLLSNLHAICADGGQLFLTGINVRKTENAQHLAYQDTNLTKGRRRGEIRLKMSYRGTVSPEFNWFHPEPVEIEELASLTGWTIERLEDVGGFFWACLRKNEPARNAQM